MSLGWTRMHWVDDFRGEIEAKATRKWAEM